MVCNKKIVEETIHGYKEIEASFGPLQNWQKMNVVSFKNDIINQDVSN